MGRSGSRRDVLLAVALSSRRREEERRMLPDQRSGIERRRVSLKVPTERRAGAERRQLVRRKDDRDEGTTLLQKARSRLTPRPHGRTGNGDRADGLR
jgi:hypothetical protein